MDPSQSTSTPQAQPMQRPQQQAAPEKKKGFPSWALFIIITLFFAALAFVAMFFYMQSKQKISFAPPFPKTSPVPTTVTEKEGTSSATPTISPTTSGAAGPTVKLSPTSTATPSATSAP